jgi:toxin ParE1/3/4
MRSCRHSSEADLDIEEIVNYIFDLNPVAAYRFLDNLEETFELLADFPLIGRRRPEIGAEVRSFPVGNYLVLYVAAGDGVEISRVVYGGRDLPNLEKR